MVTTIDKVTQEQIVIRLDVAKVVRDAPKIEKAHQILILSVDIAEDFDWSVDTQNHRLVCQNVLAFIG